MPTLAAQYVRISTEKQPLSISTQKQLIGAFANQHGFSIVRTYCDEARSGVTLRGRNAMQQLLRDVMEETCPFRSILVLDVSRWGRFQDADEAAYHEYHCRKHGVQLLYVAEPFQSSNSPFDAIVKQMKRAMAAEYSRELGVKTRGGQERVVHMGFATSSLPCVGYRRQAVAADGTPKAILVPRERKPMVSDRVRWVLGPDDEQALVRRIFSEYVRGYPLRQLARDLNAEGARTHDGELFSDTRLRLLISNEIVRGDFTWGTRNTRTAKTNIPPMGESLRVRGMVPALIEEEVWLAAVQRSVRERSFHRRGYKKEEILDLLKEALRLNPRLRAADFCSAGLPQLNVYLRHFGSTAKAFQAAGRPQTDAQLVFGEKSRHAQRLTLRFLHDLYELLGDARIDVRGCPRLRRITVEGVEVKVCGARLRCRPTPIWRVPYAAALCVPNRWLLVMRLNDDSTGKDFFLLPPSVVEQFSGTILDSEMSQWEPYRARDADGLIRLFRAVRKWPEWLPEYGDEAPVGSVNRARKESVRLRRV